MRMAGHRWLVPPAQGLLLFVLALHLCVQDPLATAEHNAATSSASLATAATVNKVTATAANKAMVATAAATNKVMAVATTTKATVATATATNKATTATTTKASVAMAVATNKAMAAATNKATVTTAAATNSTLMATASVTNSTSVATSKASVSMAAAINNASVDANSSVNGTEETPLICQSFQCSGERCYQDDAHANKTVTCHNETYCELYHFSSANYTARCSSACGTEMCRTNSSVSTQQCALDCCHSPLCLQLNASSYGDLPPTTVPPTATTTPRDSPQNGKVCAAFSCHGDGCFKGKKTVARCVVGHDFCEMKKTGLNYVAGCSKACKAAKPVCAGGMKAACYQECCPATLKASCLKLDGKVHVSSAGQVTLAPLLKLMVFGVVLLNYRVSASLWG